MLSYVERERRHCLWESSSEMSAPRSRASSCDPPSPAARRHQRADVFALQPAPIAVSMIGFEMSMGAPYVPYIAADRVALPPSSLHAYTEALRARDRLREFPLLSGFSHDLSSK